MERTTLLTVMTIIYMLFQASFEVHSELGALNSAACVCLSEYLQQKLCFSGDATIQSLTCYSITVSIRPPKMPKRLVELL